jgi:2-polyprenyl-3-methyl-5-hydroxy-6-metoxy-1,4-benzoquinol methylase
LTRAQGFGLKIKLICTICSSTLTLFLDHFKCPKGHTFPIINEIARFTNSNNYAKSFGIQWKHFSKTQLDSYTKTDYSYQRLERICGPIDKFNNQLVLEVGCGAGRFSEILLKHGAKLFAIDISNAVEANNENNKSISKNYFIAQSDVATMPFASNSFNSIICLGMIQHTANPLETLQSLNKHLKPGGKIFVDFYSDIYPSTFSRKFLRVFLRMVHSRFKLAFVKGIVFLMWPIHQIFHVFIDSEIFVRSRFIQLSYYTLLRLSPVVDHKIAYGELTPSMLKQWSILDTHDTLTDRYKHLISYNSAQVLLRSAGFAQIKVNLGGNGLEVSAVKPK